MTTTAKVPLEAMPVFTVDIVAERDADPRRAIQRALQSAGRAARRDGFRLRGNARRGTFEPQGDNQSTIRYAIDDMSRAPRDIGRDGVLVGRVTIWLARDARFPRELRDPERIFRRWFQGR